MATDASRVGLAIRESILAGRLALGERPAEILLAETFGTSRTPARLALERLEAEGLVAAAPGGGFTPRRVTLAGIKDAIALRGPLEGHGCPAGRRNRPAARGAARLRGEPRRRRRGTSPARCPTWPPTRR